MFKFFKKITKKLQGSIDSFPLASKRETEKDLMEQHSVHPDIKDLLWIENGPRKNYFKSDKNLETYTFNGITFKIEFGTNEPSLIDMDMPITKPEHEVASLPYYPQYKELSSEQKYNYWLFLSNPYQSKNNSDIGNLFILYYGLERHMFKHNLEQAIKVTIALRKIYNNKSFHYYSGNAIVLSCMLHKRLDMIQLFNESLKSESIIEISPELYLLTMWSFDEEFTPKSIMRLSKFFGFTKTNYIKGYPKMFEDSLREAIYNNTGKKGLYLSVIINDLKTLEKKEMKLFANISLSENVIKVPNLLSCNHLLSIVYKCLDEAHESVKEQLAVMRRNNVVPKARESKRKPKKLVFDYKAEGRLLKELEANKGNVLDKHFTYIHLITFYYKYRDLNEMYLKECIKYCYKDIELLKDIDRAHRAEMLAQLRSVSSIYSTAKIQREKDKIANAKFDGRIPAFERLAIIYEKSKEYNKALDISAKAITYYSERKSKTEVEKFEKRIKRIKKRKAVK